MGRDASVFYNLEHFKDHPMYSELRVDPELGCVYHPDEDRDDEFRRSVECDLEAIDLWIGNISRLAYYRGEMKIIGLPEDSLIVSRALGYDGGVSYEQLDQLKKEVTFVESSEAMQHRLIPYLVECLHKLIKAAEEQENMICFC